jgi:hypothetical protein
MTFAMSSTITGRTHFTPDTLVAVPPRLRRFNTSTLIACRKAAHQGSTGARSKAYEITEADDRMLPAQSIYGMTFSANSRMDSMTCLCGSLPPGLNQQINWCMPKVSLNHCRRSMQYAGSPKMAMVSSTWS